MTACAPRYGWRSLLDLMLGGMDGFSCIRHVRREQDVPIMVVSALTDTHDIVAALEAGADDYVSKPFEVKEISARLRALRRRARTSGPLEGTEELVLDADPREPLVLCPARAVVRRGEHDVHLTLTEYRLLRELADVPGRVLSRRTLLERVWESNFFGDERIVDVHIRRVRTKIEREPANPKIVVTVRGYGYRLDIRAQYLVKWSSPAGREQTVRSVPASMAASTPSAASATTASSCVTTPTPTASSTTPRRRRRLPGPYPTRAEGKVCSRT
jgi:DNA-binding response OmpR family regulator